MPTDDEDTPVEVPAQFDDTGQAEVPRPGTNPGSVVDNPGAYVRAVAHMTRRNADSIQAVRKRQDSDHRAVMTRVDRVEGKVDNVNEHVSDLREAVAKIGENVDTLVDSGQRALRSADLAKVEQVEIASYKRRRMIKVYSLITTIAGAIAGIVTALAAS